MITDFFVASEAELLKTFPTWLPVAPKKEAKEFFNHFTLKTETALFWVPVRRTSKTKKSKSDTGKQEYAAFKKLRHWQAKGLHWVMLAQLQELLKADDYDSALEALTRPALIKDEDEPSGTSLHQLPPKLVTALAGLSSKQVNATAKGWCKVEEMEGASAKDCAATIKSLADLAKAATEDGVNVYLWISP